MRLTDFNRASSAEAETALLTCLDVPGWAARVCAERPYADVEALAEAADTAAAGLSIAEVERAVAAHPRIGERAAGADRESSWSRQEQGAVSRDEATRLALLEGNRAYEARFDRVFLICATGLGGEQILSALRSRLGNDVETESATVAAELRKIAVLRVRKLLEGP